MLPTEKSNFQIKILIYNILFGHGDNKRLDEQRKSENSVCMGHRYIAHQEALEKNMKGNGQSSYDAASILLSLIFFFDPVPPAASPDLLHSLSLLKLISDSDLEHFQKSYYFSLFI